MGQKGQARVERGAEIMEEGHKIYSRGKRSTCELMTEQCAMLTANNYGWSWRNSCWHYAPAGLRHRHKRHGQTVSP